MIRKETEKLGKEMVPELTEQEIKRTHIHLLENYFGSSAGFHFIRERILENGFWLRYDK